MSAGDFTGSLQVLEKWPNARIYSPYLNRWSQPDTIVPNPYNPQSLNRYSYVENSPSNFTDPTGHCRYDRDDNGEIIEFVYAEDCTIEEFSQLRWGDRIRWLQIFSDTHGYTPWFNDIENTIGFLAQDEEFGDLGGYVSILDAVVLQAIQNGQRLLEGKPIICEPGNCWQYLKAAIGWRNFFNALEVSNPDDMTDEEIDELIDIRLEAEQGGIDFGGEYLADMYSELDLFEQSRIDAFLWGANFYRANAADFRSNSICLIWSWCQDVTDPRTSGVPLVNLVENWFWIPETLSLQGHLCSQPPGCPYNSGVIGP